MLALFSEVINQGKLSFSCLHPSLTHTGTQTHICSLTTGSTEKIYSLVTAAKSCVEGAYDLATQNVYQDQQH